MARERFARARLTLHLLIRSFVERPEWLAVGLLALTVATTLATTLLILRADVPRALAADLARSGPNLAVLPAAGRLGIALPDAAALHDEIARLPGARAATMIAGSGLAFERAVTVIGIDADGARGLYPRWTVDGAWPAQGADETLVTEDLVIALRAVGGESLVLTTPSGEEQVLRVTGVLHGGVGAGAEIVTSVATAARLVGAASGASTIAVRVPGARTDVVGAAARLNARVPGVDAQAIERVATMDDSVLRLLRSVLGVALGIALVCAALALTTTLTTIVVEREQEIGVMRALGAGAVRVAMIFAGESLAIGMAAGVGGFVCGSVIASLVSRGIFGTPTTGFHPGIGLTVAVLGIVVALVASIIPVGRALRVEPAVILRGE
jgi:putative ABC transport system permease protein